MYGRRPSTRELTILQELYADQGNWDSLASVMLNLHETIVKIDDIALCNEEAFFPVDA